MKPHELARLKNDGQNNGRTGSDIDLSDFDIDNVDDLLAMTTDSNTANETVANVQDHQTKSSLTSKTTKRKQVATTGILANESNNNNNKNKLNSNKTNKSPSASHLLEDQDDFDLDVGIDEGSIKKQRYSSTSSDKIWPTKQTEDTYKSLLSNLETTLQSIDTLVVGPSTKTENTSIEQQQPKQTKRKIKQESTSTAQRTQQVQLSRNDKETITTAISKGRKSKTVSTKQTKGPQMIHTEKTIITTDNGGLGGGGTGKKKSKSIITRTQTTNIDLLPKTSPIVDDYDIISPALQPPKQISSSPLHIKQEQDNHNSYQHNQQHQQQHHLMKNPPSSNHHNSSARTQSNTRHTNATDLYDAHLLLEASYLRNDLDEFLRSPSKSDKSRQRFTSESSTQFLAEQSEEEQHLIKIEPTSPDLREIVNGASSVNTATAQADLVELEVASTKNRRTNKTSHRSQRSSNSNSKYFEFTGDLSNSESAIANKRLPENLLQPHNSSSLTMKSSKSAARTEPAKSLKSLQTTASTTASYLDYTIVDDTFNAVTSSSANNNSFSSISAVVSAADASAAAAQQSNSAAAAARKPQRYFECEMCSAIFSDRAQLLDHVPIHI